MLRLWVMSWSMALGLWGVLRSMVLRLWVMLLSMMLGLRGAGEHGAKTVGDAEANAGGPLMRLVDMRMGLRWCVTLIYVFHFASVF